MGGRGAAFNAYNREHARKEKEYHDRSRLLEEPRAKEFQEERRRLKELQQGTTTSTGTP